jgi:predicted dehydrogenase
MNMSDLPLANIGRFLVVGCGSIGKRHMKNLIQLGIGDVAAFDVRSDRLEEVQSELGVDVYDDLSAALSGKPQVALICTPTSLHVPPATAAAQAGCHLFIEKPLSHSMDGVDQLLREVKQRDLVTLVGCNFRFHPGLQRVKELLEAGSIGKVVSARAEFGQYLPDWHPWEDYRQGYSAQRTLGGGVILDRIHEFDYLRWLFGEVKELFCVAGHLSHLEIDTEDIAEVILQFENGIIASAHLDYIQRTYKCELEIVGEEGTIRWSFQNHRVDYYLTSDRRWFSENWPKYDLNTMYLDEMKHFLRALAGLEEPQQDVWQASRVLEIALAARRSAENGRKVTL